MIAVAGGVSLREGAAGLPPEGETAGRFRAARWRDFAGGRSNPANALVLLRYLTS